MVTVERRGGAALLTYANPVDGTMTAQGAAELLQAVRAAAEDPHVRCLIITGGVPGVFIRHYSVGELSIAADNLAGPAAPEAIQPAGESPFLVLTDLLAALPKPVIAAINGLCMGGGFELSLACDLRIAGEQVEAIGLPEVRVAIFPGGGGTQRLPRVVGEAKALEIILRGLTFSGPEAAAMGLVHEVASDPLARALEIAVEFDQRSPDALAVAKALTRAALDRPLAEGLAAERAMFGEVLRTPAAISALGGFVREQAKLDQI
jgi:enoyl-CoA hydratase